MNGASFLIEPKFGDASNGATITSLVQELAWKRAPVRRMLGDADERPSLRLV